MKAHESECAYWFCTHCLATCISLRAVLLANCNKTAHFSTFRPHIDSYIHCLCSAPATPGKLEQNCTLFLTSLNSKPCIAFKNGPANLQSCQSALTELSKSTHRTEGENLSKSTQRVLTKHSPKGTHTAFADRRAPTKHPQSTHRAHSAFIDLPRRIQRAFKYSQSTSKH